MCFINAFLYILFKTINIFRKKGLLTPDLFEKILNERRNGLTSAQIQQKFQTTRYVVERAFKQINQMNSTMFQKIKKNQQSTYVKKKFFFYLRKFKFATRDYLNE